jgi:hypothetical protein
MLRGRQTLFEGALVEPKEQRFDFITKTECSLQPTASAISAGAREEMKSILLHIVAPSEGHE